MSIVLSKQVVALVTYYQGYTNIHFTGINKTVKVDSSVELTINKLELIAKAVA